MLCTECMTVIITFILIVYEKRNCLHVELLLQ